MDISISQPTLYTRNDFYGHRLRFMLAEKRAAVSTKIIGHGEYQPPPEFLQHINPKNIYPFLIDKHLACHGAPLEELIHERFPAPALLPLDPSQRCRDRMIASEVIRWYRLDKEAITKKLFEVSDVLEVDRAFVMGYFGVIDIALAPLMWAYHASVPAHKLFDRYKEMVFARPGFSISLDESTPEFSDEFLSEVA